MEMLLSLKWSIKVEVGHKDTGFPIEILGLSHDA